jgi:hypothetical protein
VDVDGHEHGGDHGHGTRSGLLSIHAAETREHGDDPFQQLLAVPMVDGIHDVFDLCDVEAGGALHRGSARVSEVAAPVRGRGLPGALRHVQRDRAGSAPEVVRHISVTPRKRSSYTTRKSLELEGAAVHVESLMAEHRDSLRGKLHCRPLPLIGRSSRQLRPPNSGFLIVAGIVIVAVIVAVIAAVMA